MIALDDGPPVNFCKPAVDPLFISAIDVWQAGTLAVILTGMGSDGMRGGKEIVAAGGNVIAQDEATSVVWGMPGAAAHAGICAAIETKLPIVRTRPMSTEFQACAVKKTVTKGPNPVWISARKKAFVTWQSRRWATSRVSIYL